MAFNVRNAARRDWQKLIPSFGLTVTLTARGTNAETVTVPAIATRNVIKIIETDGQEIIGENAHIGVSERAILEVNPNYPIRNAQGLVDLRGHKAEFANSNDTIMQMVIKHAYQDSTVGVITCDLSDLEINP